MRRYRLVVFALLITIGGLLVPGGTAGADGNNTCKFSTFPTAPGGASEVSVGCFLTTATGGAGNKYILEDFPQATWHSGAGRQVTITTATASGSKVLTSTSGHFTTADVNNGVVGTGIAANSFIVSVSGSTATLNNATTGVPLNTKVTVDSNDGRTLVDATFSGTAMTSTTGHFCKSTISGCGTKTDVGKTVSGTQVPNGATITAVTDASHATISAAASACPAGVPVANCKQVSLGFTDAAPPATARLLRDVAITTNNTLCSASANFQASDVNLPVLSATGGNLPGATGGRYIASVGTCTGGTKAVLAGTGGTVTNGTNQSVVIGQPSGDAPATGTTAGGLTSELSVNPVLAAGLPACSASRLTGSVLAARWNNPGAFSTSALGQPAAVTTPGAIIGQYVFFTGSGFDFGGYVVKVKASTAGESDTAAHFDVYLPALLTGTAVCNTNTAGVATTFRFSAETLASTNPNSPAQVRGIQNFTSGSHPGTAYEHIYQGATLKLNTNGACTINFPPTNGFGCGGNG